MAERNLETSSIHVYLIKFCFPKKIVFHQKSSSIKSCLSLKGVLHHRSSSIKGHLSPMFVFYQRLSFIQGCLPSKVTFHLRMSFIKGFLPSKVFRFVVSNVLYNVLLCSHFLLSLPALICILWIKTSYWDQTFFSSYLPNLILTKFLSFLDFA